MASITMTASFLSSSAATTVLKHPSTNARRGVVMAKAMRFSESSDRPDQESSTKRRDLVFAAAAAAACSLAKVAMADEEPKRGTPEAKKKYAPICVSLPTAIKITSVSKRSSKAKNAKILTKLPDRHIANSSKPQSKTSQIPVAYKLQPIFSYRKIEGIGL
ncbi:hypothetical protein Cgig2_002261 [Carnegiea gigantea]|uniref:Photosystem II 5 kDa protein, chloroplastic n=1 Tax=Carnegiea gigantea TaxID=171969 RepID=A0A9Q1KTM0_9CARY|nr:hypothetical protein Cgig2_002261 [Carnegiea gigantea]